MPGLYFCISNILCRYSMKNPILCLAVSLILLSGCQKDADTFIENLPDNSADAVTSFSGFTRYTIVKGEHYASNNAYQAIETSELTFLVRFDSTAIYQSQTAENQYDINKLYGFSDNNALHHSYSARFGWSWNRGALRLYGYVYNDGKVSSKELAAVPIGKEVRCAIKITTSTYAFYVNDQLAATLDRKATTSKASGYLLYPYFGGDEVAPHNMNIWIKELYR
jgi:hypothetical protein